MQTILAIFSLLVIFVYSNLAFGQSGNSSCRREHVARKGYARSSPSAHSPDLKDACDVFVAQQDTSLSAISYDFQSGGLINIIRSKRELIHSYQILSNPSFENRLKVESGKAQVQQNKLSWNFSDDDFSLQSVSHTESGKNCLKQLKKDEAVPEEVVQLVSNLSLDLETCNDILIVDLGKNISRQTAPLVRDRQVTVHGMVNGKKTFCQVRTGELFNYFVAEPASQEPVVVEAGYDPCYMYMVKEFSHLPPQEGFAAFHRTHPNHSCKSIRRGTMASAKRYKPLKEGLTRLSGDQDITYHLKSETEIRNLLANSKGYGCQPLAQQMGRAKVFRENTGSSKSRARY